MLSETVAASPLSDLQPEDQPSAELEPSGWSQTKAARRKQKAKKRNKQLLVQDAKQAAELSDFDDLSDLAATDDEQPLEQRVPAHAHPQQFAQQQLTANAADAGQLIVQRTSISGTSVRSRTRASRFNDKKRMLLQADLDVSGGGVHAGSGRLQPPASPRIKAAQPDAEFVALVSVLCMWSSKCRHMHT